MCRAFGDDSASERNCVEYAVTADAAVPAAGTAGRWFMSRGFGGFGCTYEAYRRYSGAERTKRRAL
jgi:hypothetical protein